MSRSEESDRNVREIAIRFCEKRGLDPHEIEMRGNRSQPRYLWYVEEVRWITDMLTCIKVENGVWQI